MTAELKLASRWIPKDSTKVEHRLAVCYTQDVLNHATGRTKYLVLAYTGNAGKRAFYESYATAEARDKRISETFAGLEASEKMRAECRAERSKPHTLKVGDIIHHSWGWEQTQCDYYQILEVTAHGATIQAIASETVEGSAYPHGMADMRLPVRDHFIEEPLKVRINGNNRVTTLEHGSATKWDGQAKYCSWYG